MKVSTADFIKNYGTLADKALTEPLTITKNGRDRFVLVEASEFARLVRRDRKVKRLEDFTPEEMDLIANAKTPEGFEHLDAELEGWTP
jgi:PHD/YefM family antitoxin component YafN of YafNO toxin-antitoxin module